MLAKVEKLEQLRFSSPNVSDEGMAHIASMRILRFLHLISLRITDDGLARLEGMSHLNSFYIDGLVVSEAAVDHLFKSIPGVHFHQDQMHLPGDPNADEH